MSTTDKISLAFGAHWLVPETAPAAWGARWIFPADQLWDRQGWHNPDSADAAALKTWLNGGALKKANAEARRLAKRYTMTQDDANTYTLYEDALGIIQGTPNRSYGYVYVAAWLKEKANA